MKKLYSSSTLFLLLSLLILPLMITNESLWLDEISTALYARQPDLASWYDHLLNERGSDSQQPLSLFVAFLTDKVMGSSQEWQLRVVNVAWGVGSILVMWHIGKWLKINWLPLLFAIQPFFWFYTNEARPYSIQILGGTLLLAGLIRFIVDEGKECTWALIFAGGEVLLYATTMLSVIPIGCVMVVGIVLALKYRWHIESKCYYILGVSWLAMFPLLIYYITTFTRVDKLAQLWTLDVKILVYIVYELIGSLGLGPGVGEIRNRVIMWTHNGFAFQGIATFILPLFFGVILFTALSGRLPDFWKTTDGEVKRLKWPIFTAILSVVVILFMLSILLQKAFWARHYSPVFAFYVLGVAFVLKHRFFVKPYYLNGITAALYVAMLVFSCFGLRFSERHLNTDYRSSAQLARELISNEKSVWWLANDGGLDYYGLQNEVSSQTKPGKIVPFYTLQQLNISALDLPDTIVVSKPDIYDRSGIYSNYIRENGYFLVSKLKGFHFWQRSDEPRHTTTRSQGGLL